MLKLYPVSTQEKIDFLELSSTLSAALDQAQEPLDLCRALRRHLFGRLAGIHGEFYRAVPGGQALLPPSLETDSGADQPSAHLPLFLVRTEPAIAQLATSGRPTIFNHPNVASELMEDSGNQSHLLTPLFDNDGFCGVLYCGHERPGFFTTQHIEGFTLLGTIIGTHVKRIGAIAGLQEHISRLQRIESIQAALYEISEAVHATESMDQLYETLHRIVGRLMSARNFFIALTEKQEDATVITFPYYVDVHDTDFQGLTITLRPGEKRNITGFLIESRSPLLTAGTEDFDEICETNDITFLGAKPSSWLGVPFYHDKISGAVVVQSYDDVVYTERDKDLLRYVANYVGDVLARRGRIEELKQARDRAEAQKQSKSAFLANMSHEIRTPMNGIIGITNLLLGSDLEEQQRSYLEMIRISSNRLLELVNDILDFSRIEAGKMRTRRSTFRLRDTLAEPMSLLRVQTAQKKIGLKSEIDNNVPELLIGDPHYLCQIVLNLMGNALKFTEAGEIRLQVSKDQQAKDIGSNRVALLFTFSDTGIGIPSDKQKKIFRAYEQLDTIGNDSYKGSGLGLVITTQLVEMMGGRIWLESESGQGSCFYVSLPFEIPTPVGQTIGGQSGAAGSEAQSGKRNVRILLAEDDRISQTIAVAMLEQNGWQVTAVNSGTEVLEELAHNDYDLILMDIQMPNLDGFETTRRIRDSAVEKTAQTPIIAMTAHALREDRERCLAAGMNGYLSKPVETRVFMEVIDKILNDSRSI